MRGFFWTRNMMLAVMMLLMAVIELATVDLSNLGKLCNNGVNPYFQFDILLLKGALFRRPAFYYSIAVYFGAKTVNNLNLRAGALVQ